LTKALKREIGHRVSLGCAVTAVHGENNDFTIEYSSLTGPKRILSRRVVCALPAPVAAAVLVGIPEWKRHALRSVPYGRFISTPIAVGPAEERRSLPRLARPRPGQVYNSNHFEFKTPTDFDREGGCFHSYVYDRHARVLWQDPDESIRAGALRAFINAHPQFLDRVGYVGLQRWKYGNPHYYPGRMKQLPALQASCDGIAFCGDYTDFSNMEGAVRSGRKVAESIARDLGLSSRV
jgi:predicted NAD/FAD-dependent oxidoreductase